jgi:hypothetical protein
MMVNLHIFFQSENRLFYLSVPELYLSGLDDLQIYMNDQLYYYLSGFSSTNANVNGQLFKNIIAYDISDDDSNINHQ